MKNEQHCHARQLYFQTGLNKSEIANELGISRRTLHYWIKENNWDRMKQAGEVIPSFLADNVYQVIGRFTDHLLSEERKDKPITPPEAAALYKMALTIGKLKTRATLSESMEHFQHFNDHLCQSKPEIAAALKPHIEQYIFHMANTNSRNYARKLDREGCIPAQDPEVQKREAILDSEDFLAWLAKQDVKEQAAPVQPAPPSQTPTIPETKPHPHSAPGAAVPSHPHSAPALGEAVPPHPHSAPGAAVPSHPLPALGEAVPSHPLSALALGEAVPSHPLSALALGEAVAVGRPASQKTFKEIMREKNLAKLRTAQLAEA